MEIEEVRFGDETLMNFFFTETHSLAIFLKQYFFLKLLTGHLGGSDG